MPLRNLFQRSSKNFVQMFLVVVVGRIPVFSWNGTVAFADDHILPPLEGDAIAGNAIREKSNVSLNVGSRSTEFKEHIASPTKSSSVEYLSVDKTEKWMVELCN
uniref:Uncharacterized protein n=1 Tax=Romanomermis culicivorax TaxID=13658 RepID=A0A915I339_ROMCU